MTIKQLVRQLQPDRWDACEGAVEWLAKQQTPEQAWRDCKRGDWLAWFVVRCGAAGKPWNEERKPFVLAMCKCLRLGKHSFSGMSMKCIETHEAWARGKATMEQCQEASWAAGLSWASWAAGAAGAAGLSGEKELSQYADIIREYYPKFPRSKA